MAGARDSFLDGLRSISILRVVLLHLLTNIGLPIVVGFSFVMPGMALLFFVSGALTARSLGANGWPQRNRLWRDRARRLLLPFWAFALVVGGGSLALDLAFEDAWFDAPRGTLARWIVPYAAPEASAPFVKLTWHLWFLPVLFAMIATAPWTLALHRRWRWSAALFCAAAGVFLVWREVPVPGLLVQTLLFGAAFLAGYGYSDGSSSRARPAWLVAAAVVLGTCSIALHARIAPGSMIHSVDIAHVGLGLAFVALWLALRVPATRLFERPGWQRFSRRINASAYTIYLWGPVANDIAWRVVLQHPAGGLPLYFVLAVILTVGLVRIFAPIERWAAGHARPRGSVLALPSEERKSAA